MVGQTISHYRIISKLGEGGMGVVYVAEDTFLGRRVALKMMNHETGNQHYRKRFLREAQAVSVLSHPNIASVHDYGETPEGTPFIVMELIEGQTLEQLLKQRALTLPLTLEIVEGVAKALSEAHRRGIIHRDIKPSNIAVTERGDVKVFDFGVAKRLSNWSSGDHEDSQALPETRTREGFIIGTPLYLSPEQARGIEVDTRSDIFSLGSVLYECLTGSPPFIGKSSMEICANVLRENPARPSQVNPKTPYQLDSVTLKSLAKSADERYQTADEFYVAVHTVRNSLSAGKTVRPSNLSRAIRALRAGVQTMWPAQVRRPGFWAAVVLASVVISGLLIGGLSLYRRSSLPPPPPAPHADAVRFYNDGISALVNGAYYRASQAFERAVNVDGNFALAQARLAETYFELDYEDKAKEAMLRANAQMQSGMSGLSADDAFYIQAVHRTITGDFEGAAVRYLEVGDRAPDSEKLLAYLSAGRAFEKSGLLHKAVETYQLLILHQPQVGAAFLRLGIVHGRKLSQDAAFTAFQQAETLYREQNNQEGIAETLYQRGYLLNILVKPDQAREHLQLALDLARSANSTPQTIKTLLQMGISFYSSDKSEISEQYIASALELAFSEGSHYLVSNGLVDLGNVYFLRGKYDEAEKYFKQALEIAAHNKAKRAEARAALSLGSLRMQQGKTDSAINSIEQALSFFNQGQYYKETSSALLLLGRARDYKGDYAGAIEALSKQLQLAQKVGDQSQVAQSHVELGTSLQHQEKYVEALDHFETSHRINHSLGLNQNVGYDLMNRGNLLWQLGKYEQARTTLDEAATIAKQSGGENKQLLAWVELFNARLALSQQDFGIAQRKSAAAYDLSRQQFKDIAAQARYVLGLTSALSGAPHVGISQCNDALALAQLTGDPRLIAYTKLALAEAQLAGGDGASALKTALTAQESFARSGQLDSHWRSLLIAALASERIRDHSKAREYAQHAMTVLSELSQRLGDASSKYMDRKDVQIYRARLIDVTAKSS